MSGLFLKIVNMSINASWMILVVLVFRLLFKRSPKWVFCLLWGLVAVRLVCPVSIESVCSLLPSSQVIPETITTDPRPMINTGISSVDHRVNPVMIEKLSPTMDASVNPIQIYEFIASILWLVGMLLFLFYALISYLAIRKKVRISVPVEAGVMICDAVKTPFILGIFRPVIYLSSFLDAEVYELVLTHERAHLKRRDHLWKPLGFALLAVYWFNPLCWLSYILFCRDIEAACDERVIKGKDKDYVAAYSQALLNLSVSKKFVSACPLAFGENGVKSRIRNILHYKKTTVWIVSAALLSCASVVLCFMTNPRTMTDRLTVDDMKELWGKALYTADLKVFSGGYEFEEIPVDDLKENLDMQLFNYQPRRISEKKNVNNLFRSYVLANREHIYFPSETGKWQAFSPVTSGEKKDSQEIEYYIICDDLDRDGNPELCYLSNSFGAKNHNCLLMYQKSGNAVTLERYIEFWKISTELSQADHIYFVKKDGTYRIYDGDHRKEYRFRFEPDGRFHMYDHAQVDVSLDLKEVELNTKWYRRLEQDASARVMGYLDYVD